ncbi:acyl-CoA synthetase [Pseudomonas sp. BN515]|uniref:acyl-CoA synthetase n=1 Tax=Pseudomonas sp. BN515 TaxID=2567892 RepID=UPI0024546E68|nr:acyl-CoA synthetase [Pseudomonas sp. BN515]MDH4874486.1 acyl-CoA synthetase [Pseudomonas sp. BN515]
MHPSIHALSAPDKAACILASSGQILSYAELERFANQGAHLFRALGLQRGDTVAVLLENGLDVFTISWAAQRCGLYLTAISNRASSNDVAYIVSDSGARVLIASDTFFELGLSAIQRLEDNAPRFFSTTAFAKERAAKAVTRIDDESPGADMLYSSGMTGRPKGVKPSLPEGPVANESPLMSMGRQFYGMGSDSIYLSTSPLYHAAPLRWALAIQGLGGTVVVMEKFDAEQTLQLIERYSVTQATFVPTHFVRILKLPAEVRDAYDYSSLRAVVHAAGPCPIEVKHAMIQWWGPIIHEYYSGTECCGLTALNAEEWLRKPGSVGRAVLGTVKILDEEGQEVPARTVGDIYFADGPRFEYHNDPEKTRKAYDHRGWATLGDIGWVDEDGYLFLTDRKSFMIISGGVNIYPQEIENVLMTHPDVDDVAVFGIADEEMGEKVVAVVKPRDQQTAGPTLAELLRAFVRESLGGVKCPQRVDFRDELPREPNGKLMKRLLREEYQKRMDTSSPD